MKKSIENTRMKLKAVMRNSEIADKCTRLEPPSFISVFRLRAALRHVIRGFRCPTTLPHHYVMIPLLYVILHNCYVLHCWPEHRSRVPLLLSISTIDLFHCTLGECKRVALHICYVP